MTDYHWIGIDAFGKKISGSVSADNKQNAKDKLPSAITVLSIQKKIFTKKNNRWSDGIQLDFLQQLHLLLHTGIPLMKALSLIETTTPFGSMHFIAGLLMRKVNDGMLLSKALMDCPDYFKNHHCSIIYAGEQSGQLDVVIGMVIDDLKLGVSTKNKISKALFYPISILVISFMISIGILLFVVPQFKTLYANFGGQLPVLTQQMMFLSQLLLHHLFFTSSLLIMFIFLIKKIMKTSYSKNKIMTLMLAIPFTRHIMMTRLTQQWSKLLAMALSSGIPLVEALHFSTQRFSNKKLDQQMKCVIASVIGGKPLHLALASWTHFPIRATYLISIGESADALADMLSKITLLYEQNLNDTVDRLSKLLEPVIMIMVASVICGLILALYLPIFRMGSVI